jgi:general secretion pathway protein G
VVLQERRPRGFTLVEIVVAVAIVGLLGFLAVPVIEVVSQRQKEQELRSALRQIRSAIDAYHGAAEGGQIERSLGASSYPPTLLVLEQGVPDISKPDRPTLYFIRKIPRDPFFADKSVPAVQTWGLRSYASSADSPEEGDDVFDVYSKNAGVGLNGVPYRQW